MLIPLDGTQLAEQILGPALALGQAMKADYTLLRVVTPIYPVTTPTEPAIFGSVAADITERIEQIHTDLKRDAGAYLDKLGDIVRLGTKGAAVQTRVAVDAQPGVAILDNAKPPIDMIAIETHGRGGLSRLLMGSVADKVIRGSRLPILVHKPTIT
jgi:nucleotide-binding universal stress UspA family protein